MNTQTTGPHCLVTSYLGGKLKSKWVPSHETDIAAGFERVRSGRPYIEDDYADVERDHHMMFANGFER